MPNRWKTVPLLISIATGLGSCFVLTATQLLGCGLLIVSVVAFEIAKPPLIERVTVDQPKRS